MKIELDNIRAFYARKYNSIGRGIGKGDKVSRAVISAWVEDNRKLIVIWGAPGSGKSYAIEQLYVPPLTMVVETTGLNATMNKFLLSLDRKLVTFVRHTAPRYKCLYRVITRDNNPLIGIDADRAEDTNRIIALVNKWFIEGHKNLPVDKETK
jgi:hypothetical protein